MRDASWSLRNDRIHNANMVLDLAGADATTSARNAYFTIQQSFAAIDRMEVRGRDSAGVNVLVWGHQIEASDNRVVPLLAGRTDDPLFTSRSVRVGNATRAWSLCTKPRPKLANLATTPE